MEQASDKSDLKSLFYKALEFLKLIVNRKSRSSLWMILMILATDFTVAKTLNKHHYLLADLINLAFIY